MHGGCGSEPFRNLLGSLADQVHSVGVTALGNDLHRTVGDCLAWLEADDGSHGAFHIPSALACNLD